MSEHKFVGAYVGAQESDAQKSGAQLSLRICEGAKVSPSPQKYCSESLSEIPRAPEALGPRYFINIWRHFLSLTIWRQTIQLHNDYNFIVYFEIVHTTQVT